MHEEEGDFRATPLWYAVARGENLPLVRFLLQRGAVSSYSLWAAVWRDEAELCRELLRAKPQLNLITHGETPIFYPARLKRLKALDLLIDAGSNPAIPDSQKRDAVDIARVSHVPAPFIERLLELKRRTPTIFTDRERRFYTMAATSLQPSPSQIGRCLPSKRSSNSVATRSLNCPKPDLALTFFRILIGQTAQFWGWWENAGAPS